MLGETELNAIHMQLRDLRMQQNDIHRMVSDIKTGCKPCQVAIASHSAILLGMADAAERGLVTRVSAAESKLERIDYRYWFAVRTLIGACVGALITIAAAGATWMFGWTR